MSDAALEGQALQAERGSAEGAMPTAEGPHESTFVSALKEALVAGAIAAGLFIPLIGLKTGDGFFGLVYRQMPFALLLIAIVAVGRFVLALTVWRQAGMTPAIARAVRAVVIGLLGFVVTYGFLGLTAGYVPTVVDEARLYISVAIGLPIAIAAYYARGSSADGAAVSVGTKVFRRPGGQPLQMTAATTSKVIGTILGLVAVSFPFLVFLIAPGQDRLYINLAIQVLTYVMLGWGLNIVVGLAGLLDLGYVAFYAVGAYSFALLSTELGMGFWFALPLAGMLAATWGLILGFPVLRLRGDYLAIVTLAFGEIIRVVLLNWYEFTGGPDGINRIPEPTLFGIEFRRGEGGFADVFGLDHDTIHRFVYLYYIILGLALLTNFVTLRLSASSPSGAPGRRCARTRSPASP